MPTTHVTTAITSLETAVDAYLAAEPGPVRDQLYEAAEEWMEASFEADGYSAVQVAGMDVRSFLDDFIDRRRNR